MFFTHPGKVGKEVKNGLGPIKRAPPGGRKDRVSNRAPVRVFCGGGEVRPVTVLHHVQSMDVLMKDVNLSALPGWSGVSLEENPRAAHCEQNSTGPPAGVPPQLQRDLDAPRSLIPEALYGFAVKKKKQRRRPKGRGLTGPPARSCGTNPAPLAASQAI